MIALILNRTAVNDTLLQSWFDKRVGKDCLMLTSSSLVDQYIGWGGKVNGFDDYESKQNVVYNAAKLGEKSQFNAVVA